MRDLAALLSAWATRRYRVMPWRSLGILALVLLYIVSPVDIIPDMIPGFGVVDDTAMLLLFVRSLLRDARSFRTWEERTRAEPPRS
jgi:uncharacterized membrane protein YkvA (DUF1232 family)